MLMPPSFSSAIVWRPMLRLCNVWRARVLRRSEEHTSELQSQSNLVCRLLLEKKKNSNIHIAVLHTLPMRAITISTGVDDTTASQTYKLTLVHPYVAARIDALSKERLTSRSID